MQNVLRFLNKRREGRGRGEVKISIYINYLKSGGKFVFASKVLYIC